MTPIPISIVFALATINVVAVLYTPTSLIFRNSFRLPTYLKLALRVWASVIIIEIVVSREWYCYASLIGLLLCLSAILLVETRKQSAYLAFTLLCSVSWFGILNEYLDSQEGELLSKLFKPRFLISLTSFTSIMMRGQIGIAKDISNIPFLSVGLTIIILYLWAIEKNAESFFAMLPNSIRRSFDPAIQVRYYCYTINFSTTIFFTLLVVEPGRK